MEQLKIRMAFFLSMIISTTTLPCMAMEEVSFRHKTAKPPKLKIDCRKKMGKHDAFPTYTCFDKEGNAVAFDPGNDWEEVMMERLCLQHKVIRNIRPCIKIVGKQDRIKNVGCVDVKGNLYIISPDQSEWIEIDAENPDCKPHIIEMDDIPRGTIEMRKKEIDRSKNGKSGK